MNRAERRKKAAIDKKPSKGDKNPIHMKGTVQTKILRRGGGMKIRTMK